MLTTDRRPSREPQDLQERSSMKVAERPAVNGRPEVSYYDPDASTFDDVRRPGQGELVTVASVTFPSADLLGVSRS